MALYFYEEIDELGEGLIRQYLGAEADNTFCVDIEGFVTEFLGLPLFYRTFAEKDSDKIGFISDGITPLWIYKNGTIIPTIFSKGTIVIEKCLRRENESGRRRFSISHDGTHFSCFPFKSRRYSFSIHSFSCCLASFFSCQRRYSFSIIFLPYESRYRSPSFFL